LISLKAQLTSIEGQRQQSNASSAGTSIAQQSLLIEQAEKDATAQEQSLNRAKALYEVGAISQVQYDEEIRLNEKAKNNLAIQKNALQLLYANTYGSNLYYSGQKSALNAQISQLEDKISNARIAAPQDGFVKDIDLKVGSVVPFGEYVLSVYQKQGYKLESYVLASDVLGLKAGAPVELIQDTGDGKKSLAGQIQHIDSSAVERISPLGLKENRVKVTLVLPSDTPVVLGSNMDVKFTTAQESDQLVIPKTAIFSYQDGYAVWIVKNGKAKIQPVVKGLENDQSVVIQEGLNDGTLVLLDTELTGLKEGKRISNTAS
jgi:HlyD family secretion protein